MSPTLQSVFNLELCPEGLKNELFDSARRTCERRYDLLHAWTTRHVATIGRTVTSFPKIPCPSPNDRKSLILMDNQKMEPPKSMVPKVAEQTSRLRSCMLCVQGSALKQDAAPHHAISLRPPLGTRRERTRARRSGCL